MIPIPPIRPPMKTASLLIVALLSFTLIGNVRSQTVAPETASQYEARMKWWKEARFGLFIHWGLYSIRVQFFEKTGGDALTVSWEGPGFSRREIPDRALFRDR